ncbi:MAG: hypothetical protein IJL39_00615 [Clostridia bacterium]|nr:hypothetical protein [Clostridia bacterium]
MTSKSSFCDFSLLRGRLKRGAWLPGLFATLLFFTLPVATALTITNYRPREYYIEAGYDYTLIQSTYQRGIQNLVENTGIIAMLFAVLAGTLCALIAWNYLNSRRQVDLYHSLPRSRTTLFGSSYLYGLLSFLLPLIVMEVLALLVISLTGFLPYLDWSLWLRTLCRITVLFLSCYAICTVACQLCGNILVAMLGCATFLSFFPALITLLNYAFSRYFETFVEFGDTTEKLYRLTSPIADLLFAASFGTAKKASPYWLWWIAVSAGCTLIALLLHQRRPSEAAANALAFRVSRPFIKYPIMAVVTMVFGFFFEGIGGNDGWLLFGCAAGMICCHAVLEAIFDFDLRSIFKNLKGLGAFAICFALFLGTLYFDWLGFDKRLPDRGNLTDISLSIDRFSNLYSSTGIEHDRFSSYTSMLKNMRFDDPELIDLACRLAESGVSALEQNLSDPHGQNVTLTFRKGVSSYTRSYSRFDQDITHILYEIFDNPRFQEQFYFVYQIDPAELEHVSVTDHWRYYSQNNFTRSDPALLKDLIEALKADIPTVSAQELSHQDYLYTMDFYKPDGSNYLIPVYAGYEKTRAVLRNSGAAEPPALSAGELSSIMIQVYPYQYNQITETVEVPGLTVERIAAAVDTVRVAYDDEKRGYLEMDLPTGGARNPLTPIDPERFYNLSLLIEDEELIELLLPMIYNSMRSWYNPFLITEGSFTITLNPEIQGETSYPDFYFTENYVPRALYDYINSLNILPEGEDPYLKRKAEAIPVFS